MSHAETRKTFASLLVINIHSLDMIIIPALSKIYPLTRVTIAFVFRTRALLRVKLIAIINYDMKTGRQQDYSKNPAMSDHPTFDPWR